MLRRQVDSRYENRPDLGSALSVQEGRQARENLAVYSAGEKAFDLSISRAKAFQVSCDVKRTGWPLLRLGSKQTEYKIPQPVGNTFPVERGSHVHLARSQYLLTGTTEGPAPSCHLIDRRP